MQSMKIVNPKTKREVTANVWEVSKSAVFAELKKRKDVRDVSWMLLNDRESTKQIKSTMDGDCARTNAALRVFEHALDWSLGLTIIRFMRDVTAIKRRIPDVFQVAATRSGDVFIMLDGKIIY